MPNHFHFLIVVKPEDLEFSSYGDYLGMRKETLVNIELAEQIIEFEKENFAEWSKAVLDEKMHYAEGLHSGYKTSGGN